MIDKIINAIYLHEKNVKDLISYIESLGDDRNEILRLAIKELDMEPNEFLYAIVEYEYDFADIIESINKVRTTLKEN